LELPRDIAQLDAGCPARDLVTHMHNLAADNAACIDREIAWFRQILDARFELKEAEFERRPFRFPPPHLPAEVPYAEVIRSFDMTPEERLVLMLAFLPYIRPGALDPFLVQNESLNRRFTEFGGVTGAAHSGFLPTVETALFLLAGDSTEARLHYFRIFHPDHYFYRFHILQQGAERRDGPPFSAVLHLTPGILELLTTGENYWPPFSAEFPAQRIATAYEWEDLVVEPATLAEIEDIVNWVRYQDTLLDDWDLRKRVKPGYRTLFYGPPGTGKSLTAALLGKATDMPVFRVDLSSVISKYIGETEKNLASLFDRAEHQGWILFFDEADSLFGKRTETRNSNDRAANQQVSYLLQRIEDFAGVIILASNLRSQIDEAFARRFQSMIHFPMPAFKQRLRLWQDHFRDKPYRLAADVDLEALARDHELSGGSIVNVLRYVCLQAVARDSDEIQSADLQRAVRAERHKEGKFLGGSQTG
jgi:hypothetical protein